MAARCRKPKGTGAVSSAPKELPDRARREKLQFNPQNSWRSFAPSPHSSGRTQISRVRAGNKPNVHLEDSRETFNPMKCPEVSLGLMRVFAMGMCGVLLTPGCCCSPSSWVTSSSSSWPATLGRISLPTARLPGRSWSALWPTLWPASTTKEQH